MYGREAFRQLGDTSIYTELNSDPTLSHQKIVKTTINNLIQAGDLLATAFNVVITTPRTPIIDLSKILKPINPCRPIISAYSCLASLFPGF